MDSIKVQSDTTMEPLELSSDTTSHLTGETSLDILRSEIAMAVKSLKLGRVRGLVNIFAVQDIQDENRHYFMSLIQELISRDILVVVCGAADADCSHGMLSEPSLLQHADEGLTEFCDFLGIAPVMHIAPEMWPTTLLGLYDELSLGAQVNTGDLPIVVLGADPATQQSERYGTAFTMGNNPAVTTDSIDMHIHEQRVKIGWCDRCGGCFSPFS